MKEERRDIFNSLINSEEIQEKTTRQTTNYQDQYGRRKTMTVKGISKGIAIGGGVLLLLAVMGILGMLALVMFG